MTRDEFIHWTHNPVTEELHQRIMSLANQEKILLADRCGKDSAEDSAQRGYIKGMIEAWDLKTLREELFTDESDSQGTPLTY